MNSTTEFESGSTRDSIAPVSIGAAYMTQVYEVMEVYRRGKAIGRYRLVYYKDNTPEDLHEVCQHDHETADEALLCPLVQRKIEYEFRERIVMPENQSPTLS